MKRQFDTHHGAKPRLFVPGQSVTIRLSNGKRIPGNIDKLIGSTIARISFEGGFLIRHFNQIWNRSATPPGSLDFQPIDEETLPSAIHPTSKQSTETHPATHPVSKHSENPKARASSLGKKTSPSTLPLNEASRSTLPSNEASRSTLPSNEDYSASSDSTASNSEKVFRRSERLLRQPRLNYKVNLRQQR